VKKKRYLEAGEYFEVYAPPEHVPFGPHKGPRKWVFLGLGRLDKNGGLMLNFKLYIRPMPDVNKPTTSNDIDPPSEHAEALEDVYRGSAKRLK